MPVIRKVDATGRTTGKIGGRLGRNMKPPKDEPWVWLSRELLTSDAWQARSITCVRLIDALLIEHMNHAGIENGNLAATYDQLQACRISRGLICSAILEAEYLGLVRCQRGGRWAGNNQPSRYRLTFLGDKEGNFPSNEWKGKKMVEIKAWKKKQRKKKERRKEAAKNRKKQIPSAPSDTTVVPHRELPTRNQLRVV